MLPEPFQRTTVTTAGSWIWERAERCHEGHWKLFQAATLTKMLRTNEKVNFWCKERLLSV
jgi:hypothetical protein